MTCCIAKNLILHEVVPFFISYHLLYLYNCYITQRNDMKFSSYYYMQ